MQDHNNCAMALGLIHMFVAAAANLALSTNTILLPDRIQIS